MGSLLQKGHSKAGERTEKGSAILRGQLQPLCKRGRIAARTSMTDTTDVNINDVRRKVSALHFIAYFMQFRGSN